jgi:hypothetical protein
MKMKIVIAAVMLLAVTIGAQASDDTTKVDKKKKAAAAPPPALTIPKDAVLNPGGLNYSWTDKQGKRWIYAKTPFGISKFAASDAAETAPDLSGTKAIDKGDTVRFERPTPFGPGSWEKKKAELTDDERHLLDAQNAKTEEKK